MHSHQRKFQKVTQFRHTYHGISYIRGYSAQRSHRTGITVFYKSFAIEIVTGPGACLFGEVSLSVFLPAMLNEYGLETKGSDLGKSRQWTSRYQRRSRKIEVFNWTMGPDTISALANSIFSKIYLSRRPKHQKDTRTNHYCYVTDLPLRTRLYIPFLIDYFHPFQSSPTAASLLNSHFIIIIIFYHEI